MRYSGIIYNDFSAAPGVSLSFFTQGCPHHCTGCHNPETWLFDGGLEFTEEILQEILKNLYANGIKRNFCLMGGEPLCPENLPLSKMLIENILQKYPDTKIYIWTGYVYEYLLQQESEDLKYILSNSDVLIDGPYIVKYKDLTLKMRGSSNQRIINLKT